jgi:hypothetical protein
MSSLSAAPRLVRPCVGYRPAPASGAARGLHICIPAAARVGAGPDRAATTCVGRVSRGRRSGGSNRGRVCGLCVSGVRHLGTSGMEAKPIFAVPYLKDAKASRWTQTRCERVVRSTASRPTCAAAAHDTPRQRLACSMPNGAWLMPRVDQLSSDAPSRHVTLVAQTAPSFDHATKPRRTQPVLRTSRARARDTAVRERGRIGRSRAGCGLARMVIRDAATHVDVHFTASEEHLLQLFACSLHARLHPRNRDSGLFRGCGLGQPLK